MLRPGTSLAAVCALLFGCSDAQSPTDPSPRNGLGSQVTDSLQLYFLPPLAPQREFTGAFQPTINPDVEVCEWKAERCVLPLVSRFTTASVPGSERVRVSSSENGHYIVNWHTGQPDVSNGRVYRIRVLRDGAEMGAVSVKIAPGLDGSDFQDEHPITITKGQTLPIKFRIESTRTDPSDATPRLKVVLGQGVHGNPGTSDSIYRSRARVWYAFEAAPGYENVRVMLDGEYVAPRGTVVMDQAHLLVATADVRVSVPPGGEDLLRSARAILSSKDPVAAYQSHLDAIVGLFAEVGEVEADRRLDIVDYLAYDPIQDADALIRVDSALAGRVFHLRHNAPLSQRRLFGVASALTASQSTSGTPSTPFYVNGILNSLGAAGQSTVKLSMIVREVGTSNITDVRLLYNRTYSAQMTPFERRTTMCLQDLARAEHFLGDLSLRLRYLRCMGDFGQHLVENFDLVESIRQVLEVTGRAGYTAEADARVISDTIREEWRSGRNVILVPHSQGNLMSQQAISYLNSTAGADAGIGRCVGAVSLAAPVSTGWALTQGTDLFGVAVRGDMILWLGMNKFSRTATALSRQADAEIAAWEGMIPLIGPGARAAARIAQAKWGLRLHGAVESYMQQFETRQQIRAGIQRLAERNCGELILQGLWPSSPACVEVGLYVDSHFRLTLRTESDAMDVTYKLFTRDVPVYDGPATKLANGFAFTRVTQDWTGARVPVNYHTHRFAFTRNAEGTWEGTLNYTHTLITDEGDRSSSAVCQTPWVGQV